MRFGIVRVLSHMAAVLGVSLILFTAGATVAPDLFEIARVRVVPGLRPAPAVAVVLSVFAFWFHVLTCRGYRRLPFWTAALTGTAIILGTVGFGWKHELPHSIAPIHQGFALLLGLLAFTAARAVMACTFLRTRSFIITFLGAITLLGAALLRIPADTHSGDLILYRGELDELIALLDPRYREVSPEVEEYLQEIARDESLSREDQERLVRELNREIETLGEQIRRFQVVEKERETYAAEVERLRRELSEVEAAARLSPEDLTPARSYQEAVRPALPVVRDFAARLAGEHPGSYHLSWPDPVPSRTGLKQVLAIHRYVSGRWRYVNDPLYIRGNYFSPPERTIANSFTGDCDDFAILLASAVEAIGGTVRILHGTCTDGAHAWAEVYLGNRESAWREAEQLLRQRFPGRRIERQRVQPNEGFWLSLDWQVGIYSCGDSPVEFYRSNSADAGTTPWR